jgi:ribokinase
VVNSSYCQKKVARDERKYLPTHSVANVTIYNLGSINIDHLYMLQTLPKPSETLASIECMINIGGKGMNISVAAHRSDANVKHVGVIGMGDTVVRKMIDDLGLNTELISCFDAQTGHAIVYVDRNSENCIVVHGGANLHFREVQVRQALSEAKPEDWLVLQNETNANEMGIAIAREKGMKIALVAAPFDAETMPSQIRKVDLVSMNRSEVEQFEIVSGMSVGELKNTEFLITYGADGAQFLSDGQELRINSHRVPTVDTTGAGDTFFGVFMAGYTNGVGAETAIRYANAAAALMVQRKGTASVVPTKSEISTFLKMCEDI